MRNETILQRYDFLAATAAVGAHANAKAEGFRQRDMRFLIDLFSNWLEATFEGNTLPVQNTQVQRYIEELVNQGYARNIAKSKHPLYRLTRTGLIELTSRIVDRPHYQRPEHFFFVYYFIENYSPRIFELVRAEGTRFPYSLELELRDLLSSKNLIKNQVLRAERELQKLNARITDAIKTGKLAVDAFTHGKAVEEVVSHVEKLYPYELNSQKPLSELFANLTPEYRRWELEVGSVKRAEHIWIPMRSMLGQFIDILKRFKGS